jgi:hypothetical protein
LIHNVPVVKLVGKDMEPQKALMLPKVLTLLKTLTLPKALMLPKVPTFS